MSKRIGGISALVVLCLTACGDDDSNDSDGFASADHLAGGGAGATASEHVAPGDQGTAGVGASELGGEPQAGAGAEEMWPDAADEGEDQTSDPGWNDDDQNGGSAGETGDDVPNTAHCAPVADWDPGWAAWEVEVLQLTNARRAAGATCGRFGSYPPADPLTMNPELRCAARLHSEDMGVNGYFAHNSQDGTTPFQRMQAAGYSGGTFGENIAQGSQSPADVVQGWMDSDEHCINIMNERFTELGVGFWEGEPSSVWFNSNLYWTQKFGGPGGVGGGDDCPWPWC